MFIPTGLAWLLGLMIITSFFGNILLLMSFYHLASRIDELYKMADQGDDRVLGLISQVWFYTEAVDDAKPGESGSALYLQRLYDRADGADQRV